MRRIAISLAASALSLPLAACGSESADAGSSGPTKANDITVGLLLPEKENARYEKFDKPIIEKKVESLTEGGGRVVYANAEQDAARQRAQLAEMVEDEVDVVLLDAVDSHDIASGVKAAKAAGVPVVAYDRLAEGPVEAYVSFDNEMVGEVQGRTLVEAMNADSTDKVVMMNGAVTDPNAAQFKKGALAELSGKVNIVKQYDTEEWKPENAEANMREAIAAVGKGDIAGVYSANDGMAGGIVAALKAAGVTDLPPITGQDAELAAVQRILAGEQYMSVYKPYAEEAEAAAEIAVARVRGHGIEFDALTRDKVDSPTKKRIPARLVSVLSLTKDTIKDTVIQDGVYEVSEICTAKYKAACAEAGIE
ncbi:solute-binding protein [Streptomyces minutiscleroticus]|uniref:Solute-binding protein n=2 Tax=Streptomyces minutiscleroticus TaxID=68238 RepID=A0A918KSB2_9ACTN|nr:solute-binding protein [Streptomyces minutiscleroticus]